MSVKIGTLLILEDVCRHDYNNKYMAKVIERSWLWLKETTLTGNGKWSPVFKFNVFVNPSIHQNLSLDGELKQREKMHSQI